MGLLGSIKSAVSARLTQNHYRQSTLYDFSVVTRAVIYVYSYNNLTASELSSSRELKMVEKLTVQINPGSYKRMKFNKGIDVSSSDSKVDWSSIAAGSKSSRENSLDVDLVFDISDEYMAVSNNGLIAYDVDIDSATIINALYKYSNPGYLCLFKWGPLNYLSRISSVNCTYEKFSPYGEPLRATVSISFKKLELSQSIEYSDDDPRKIIGETNWETVKKNQVLDSGMVIARKAAEEAANELLPSIISQIR